MSVEKAPFPRYPEFAGELTRLTERLVEHTRVQRASVRVIRDKLSNLLLSGSFWTEEYNPECTTPFEASSKVGLANGILNAKPILSARYSFKVLIGSLEYTLKREALKGPLFPGTKELHDFIDE